MSENPAISVDNPQKCREKKMAHYFTREEAETLLPQISVILRSIQQERKAMREQEEKLGALKGRARSNGHDLNEQITTSQAELARHIQELQALAAKLDSLGGVLKDPDTGLIDFLSLRNGHPIYLCWRLGEERINYWHEIDNGFAGRQLL